MPDAADFATIDRPPGRLGEGTSTDPRLVVDAWLAVPTADGWRALLLRRAPNNGGFWQGVSGRVETFDASLRQAALREIREETGVAADVVVHDLGRWIEFRGGSGAHFRKRSLGAVLPEGLRVEGVVLSDEHDDLALVTFEEARRRVRFAVNVEELSAFEALLRDRAPA